METPNVDRMLELLENEPAKFCNLMYAGEIVQLAAKMKDELKSLKGRQYFVAVDPGAEDSTVIFYSEPGKPITDPYGAKKAIRECQKNLNEFNVGPKVFPSEKPDKVLGDVLNVRPVDLTPLNLQEEWVRNPDRSGIAWVRKADLKLQQQKDSARYADEYQGTFFDEPID